MSSSWEGSTETSSERTLASSVRRAETSSRLVRTCVRVSLRVFISSRSMLDWSSSATERMFFFSLYSWSAISLDSRSRLRWSSCPWSHSTACEVEAWTSSRFIET